MWDALYWLLILSGGFFMITSILYGRHRMTENSLLLMHVRAVEAQAVILSIFILVSVMTHQSTITVISTIWFLGAIALSLRLNHLYKMQSSGNVIDRHKFIMPSWVKYAAGILGLIFGISIAVWLYRTTH